MAFGFKGKIKVFSPSELVCVWKSPLERIVEAKKKLGSSYLGMQGDGAGTGSDVGLG